MKRVAIVVLLGLLLGPIASSIAAPLPMPGGPMQALAGCRSLAACVRIIDRTIPRNDPDLLYFVEGEEDGELSALFQQFGDRAKQEIVRRATGTHESWRHLADGILRHWPGWTDADVPTLRRVLRANPSGLIADTLGEIGTPAAIEVLVEDLKSNKRGPGHTGLALQKLGSRAVPYLIFIPEGDVSLETAIVSLGEMDFDDAGPALRYWATTAADSTRPDSVRTAAIQGLAELRNVASGQAELSPVIRPLLDDPKSEIREGALKVLRRMSDPKMLDPSILPRLVEFCNPTSDPYRVSSDSEDCLAEIAGFGAAAQNYAGPIAEKFLTSANGTDRSDAATVLGFLDYQPAVPRLMTMLEESDWRAVYAAARALGWLDAREAIPALDRVASSHWLPEVRLKATETSAVLKAQNMMPRPSALSGSFFSAQGRPREANALGIRMDMRVITEQMSCQHGFEWQGQKIVFPAERQDESRITFSDGNLIGSNLGEFGGALTWQPRRGQAEVLHKENTSGVARAGEGAVAVVDVQSFLATGDSYALHIERSGRGPWRLAEIGRLPTGTFGISVLGPDLFATWGFSNNLRVVVFSSKEILGLAKCAAAP
jgi:HEAT repeat protein